MRDLFSDDQELKRIPMPDAEVYYLPQAGLFQPPKQILESLIREVPWKSESVVMWGKTYDQPRLVAWYGDSRKSYSYSGITLNPLPWSDTLLKIKRRIEDLSSVSFNSVLLNYYRNNRDSMGFHSDNEKELGPNPIIASVSLGEERTFVFKHKEKSLSKPVRIKLNSGSLLLMQGETQHNWKHGIEKEANPCGPRINLTFRRIY